MSHIVTIKSIERINHNVIHIITDKPQNYIFKPGQATDIAIDKEGYRDKKRPFTFTSLPDDKVLDFIIKIYPSHDGVTEQMERLIIGNQLRIGDAWGAISYKGEGAFIAGGAGITPFISILKDLKRKGELGNNQLFFSNKEEKDIIEKNNLQAWLGNRLHLILSNENNSAYDNGHISKKYLEKYDLEPTKPVYLCGPPPMMEAITSDLNKIGLPKSQLVTEGFN